MGHLYVIKLVNGPYIIRNTLADQYLKLYQVNSDGSELPIWCHSLMTAARLNESEVKEITGKLEKLGYKIHFTD